ncbi:MAG TPA: hypothetical protein VH620_13585 [Gaiella sp.]|jgi:hypothetical protein
MRGSEHTSVEEQVMSSARGYLYGHPLAWELPGRGPRREVAPSTSLRTRLVALRAAVARRFADAGPVAVEPGGCA